MTGGGDSKYFSELDSHFYSLLSLSPTLLVIPLAEEDDDFEYSLERITESFSSIHFEEIKMCTDLRALNWDYLESFDAVYIDGGNTFKLMESIRQSHLYELLRRFLHRGGIINGDSAGAIIMGSHLETAHFGEHGDENDSELISYQGLNLIGDLAIHCHYNKSEDSEIRDFVSECGLPVLALTEETGLSLEENVIKVFGFAQATLFGLEKMITIKVGEKFCLDSETFY